MDLADFIRRVSESSGKLLWFLGAGASQSAGLPTAVDLIWNLKRRYYISEEQQEISSNDLQNPAIREKIDAYMASLGFPETSDPTAYSRTFELIFGADYERQRRHLQGALSEKDSALTLGHRIFAALVAMGAIRSIFTTNFDSVVERALAEVSGQAVSAFHLEGSYAANEAINNEEFPVYCKLHGDFRYQSLKNLSDDLKTQNDELGRAFVNAANRFGAVIAGYSGRDESVMRLFHNALQGPNAFPHGIFWTGLKGRSPFPAVLELVGAARNKGITAEYIEIETFDSMMSRIWKQTPKKPADLVSKIGRQGSQSVVIPLTGAGTGDLLRLNALPVTKIPTHCLELSFRKEMDWKGLRAAERRSRGEIICTKGQSVWAWGSRLAVQAAFGEELVGLKEIDLDQMLSNLKVNQHLKGFVEQAICKGLCRGKPLLHRVWRNSSVLILDRRRPDSVTEGIESCVGPVHGQIPNLMSAVTEENPTSEPVFWAEALKVDFEEIDGVCWLVLKPDVWIWPKHARIQAANFLDRRVGGRLNKKADQLLSAWLAFLFPSVPRGSDQVVRPFSGPEDAERPSFSINTRTAFSRRMTA